MEPKLSPNSQDVFLCDNFIKEFTGINKVNVSNVKGKLNISVLNSFIEHINKGNENAFIAAVKSKISPKDQTVKDKALLIAHKYFQAKKMITSVMKKEKLDPDAIEAIASRYMSYVKGSVDKPTFEASLDKPYISKGKLYNSEYQLTPIVKKTIKAFASLPEKKTATLNKTETNIRPPSSSDFQSYVLERKIHPNKKQLLENTILNPKTKLISPKITTKIVKMEGWAFEDLLNTKTAPSKTKVETTTTWYDYKEPNSYWVDFANATTFGGGYRGRGNVQEETMFFEFPELSYLDRAVKGQIHPCTEGDRLCPTDATPFIVENVTRQWRVDPSLYGRALEEQKFNDKISEKDGLIQHLENQPPVSIIGIAAMDWGPVAQNERKYQLSHLEYHLKAAYLGNIGAKGDKTNRIAVHTSAWGCGAFKNCEKMMIGIQILAAHMSDVDLIFHGAKKSLANPDYDPKTISEIESLIQNNLNQGKTPNDILRIFLDKQETDPSWAPKA